MVSMPVRERKTNVEVGDIYIDCQRRPMLCVAIVPNDEDSIDGPILAQNLMNGRIAQQQESCMFSGGCVKQIISPRELAHYMEFRYGMFWSYHGHAYVYNDYMMVQAWVYDLIARGESRVTVIVEGAVSKFHYRDSSDVREHVARTLVDMYLDGLLGYDMSYVDDQVREFRVKLTQRGTKCPPKATRAAQAA